MRFLNVGLIVPVVGCILAFVVSFFHADYSRVGFGSFAALKYLLFTAFSFCALYQNFELRAFFAHKESIAKRLDPILVALFTIVPLVLILFLFSNIWGIGIVETVKASIGDPRFYEATIYQNNLLLIAISSTFLFLLVLHYFKDYFHNTLQKFIPQLLLEKSFLNLIVVVLVLVTGHFIPEFFQSKYYVYCFVGYILFGFYELLHGYLIQEQANWNSDVPLARRWLLAIANTVCMSMITIFGCMIFSYDLIVISLSLISSSILIAYYMSDKDEGVESRDLFRMSFLGGLGVFTGLSFLLSTNLALNGSKFFEGIGLFTVLISLIFCITSLVLPQVTIFSKRRSN